MISAESNVPRDLITKRSDALKHMKWQFFAAPFLAARASSQGADLFLVEPAFSFHHSTVCRPGIELMGAHRNFGRPGRRIIKNSIDGIIRIGLTQQIQLEAHASR